MVNEPLHKKEHMKILPSDHYQMLVTYAPLPCLTDLIEEFGDYKVSIVYDGRTWKIYPVCVNMDRTPDERTFFLHDVGRDWEWQERIAWGLAQRTPVAPNGYRPATPEEMYEFSKAHPELVDYVALGSFTWLDFDQRCVASVLNCDGTRHFSCLLLRWVFEARYKILFVVSTEKEVST